MGIINQTFSALRAKNEKAFVPFLVIGDPTPELFMEIIQTVEPYADIIELGIPFSDPLADGPVIQTADVRALKAGSNLGTSFESIRQIRHRTSKPIVILTYANIIGIDNDRLVTLKKFAEAGVNGIIIADVPVEESEDYAQDMAQVGIDLIYLVTPTTDNIRLQKIAELARGFLYLVSVKGITGARETLIDETTQTIKRITQHLQNSKTSAKENIPVCVGFGISTPDHVRNISNLGADGVIVGSALISRIEKNLENPQIMLREIDFFMKTMKDATKITTAK